MSASTLEVRPLTGVIGAEIFGPDLSKDLSPDLIKQIREVFLRYGVIFFRDQDLTPEQHLNFSRKFGPIVINPVYGSVDGYPEIMPVIKDVNDKYNIGDTWHSDMSFMNEPPTGSILYAREIPPFGGDTLWTNMYAAYEFLPETLKKALLGMNAVHSDSFLTSRIEERNTGRSTKLVADPNRPEIRSVHPVIRTHDETKKKALYVNYPFTHSFEGMSREESLPLLNQLYAHSTKPEFTCRFRWQKGSVAFWDNRCTMHYACNDYQGYRRVMNRITIAGPKPA
jgi:taurine dioxygenase